MSIEGHVIRDELIKEILKRRKDYEDALKNGSTDVQYLHDLWQDVSIASLLEIHGVGGPPPPPPPPPEGLLQIIKASSTSDDGNVATNVFDGKPDTRWSAKGDGQELYLDINRSQVTRVEIDWYLGDPVNNQRRANFDIKANNVVIHTGSAGARAIIPVNVETTQITIVGHKNNINDWNSINEVRLIGKAGPPPPPPPTCPPGRIWDPVLQRCILVCPQGEKYDPVSDTCVPINPPTDVDKFGIKKIYKDTTPSKFYEKTGGGDLEQHGDYRREWEISTPPYTNIEITGYFKVHVSREDTISIKPKGAKHTGPEPQYSACCNIHYVPFSGVGKSIGKQCPHLNYKELSPQTKFTLGNIRDRWIGIKAVEWNENGNVHWQTWIDETDGLNGGEWKLWMDFVETTGSIGDDADTDPPFTKSPWRGDLPPTILMRVDFPEVPPNNDVEAKKISAREIIPPGTPPPPPPPCPSGQCKDPVTGQCRDLKSGETIDPITGNCKTVPPPPPGQLGPYKSTGKKVETTTRGPTVRHYASGKPDDWTIEKNAKNVEFKDYQFIVETTVGKIEHDDTISLKFGGTHMGSGWFDTGVSFESGETCLGTEEHHPSTDLCIVRGPKIGNILNKKIKIAGVYFRDRNHIELWTKLEGGQWIKQVEGDNVGGFNPESEKDECQERIDGFEKDSVPQLHLAVVEEIESGTPPPPPPPTCPPGQHWDPVLQKCVPNPPPPPPPPEGEVKMMYPTKPGSQVGTFRFSSSNAGRAQFVYDQGACMLNQEITGYLFIQGTSNMGEEVSIKIRGGRHTDDDNSLGCCYIIGAEYNGAVNAQWECPHPSNHAFPMHGDPGKFNPGSLVGKWFGIKACVYQKGNVDKIECYLDMGGLNSEQKPVNDWKLFWEHETNQFVGKCNGKNENRVYFRLDDIQGDPEENVQLKFATAREIVPP